MLYSILWHARCITLYEHARQKWREIDKSNKKPSILFINLEKGKINPYRNPGTSLRDTEKNLLTMKKTFVTVTLFVAMAVAANAASRQLDQAADNRQSAVNNTEIASNQEDIYRAHVLQSDEMDKHIIRFYDIDRIVIKNDQHAIIRIYDANWRLIEETRDDVDKDMPVGNYYVTCTSHIKSSYVL